MSDDIQRFLTADRVGRIWTPFVLPSPSPAPISTTPVRASRTSHPRSSLVPGRDHDAFGTDFAARHGDEREYPGVLRHSGALDLSGYTGSAELRGAIVPITKQRKVRKYQKLYGGSGAKTCPPSCTNARPVWTT